MGEYKSIAVTLTDVEQTLYTNSLGMIVKTILLQDTTTNKNATLIFDGVAFNFELNEGTTIISTPIMVKSITGVGNGVNIHLTGLQL